ncbi:MAG: hypothetical protein ACI4HI_17830 [Lachnospiraceae bacterium]
MNNTSWNYFKESLRRCISWKYLILLFACAACYIPDVWGYFTMIFSEERRDAFCVQYMVFNSWTFGGHCVGNIMPMLTTMAATITYCKEKNAGIDTYLIGRIGNRLQYAKVKACNSVLMGGLTAFLGSLLFVALMSCRIPLITAENLTEMKGLPFSAALGTGNGIGYFIAVFYLLALHCMLCNMAALCVSVYVPNPYMVIATPILLSYGWTRLMVLLDVPMEWRLNLWLSSRTTVGEHGDICTLIVTTIVVLCLLGIGMAWFVYKNRDREES